MKILILERLKKRLIYLEILFIIFYIKRPIIEFMKEKFIKLIFYLYIISNK